MNVDSTSVNIDLKLCLEFNSVEDPMHVILGDQSSTLADIKNINTKIIEIDTKITFPNTLTFQLSNHSSNAFVKLQQLWVGGIRLQQNIIDQICLFQPENQNTTIVTNNWYHNGTIKIEFFTPDFIQYHLIYNNKIF